MAAVVPLISALFLAPVSAPSPPPAFAIFASPDDVTLILATNRQTPMHIADPREVDGLGYSLMFIRVRGPDGDLIPTEDEEGWWTPLYRRSWPGPDLPKPWTIRPGEFLTLHTAPSRLTRDMPDAARTGQCAFQVRAILRDADRWPWREDGAEGGVYTVQSTWTPAPCASLFSAP